MRCLPLIALSAACQPADGTPEAAHPPPIELSRADAWTQLSPAEDPLTLHVHNHGSNSWFLGAMTVQPIDTETP